MGRLCTHPNGRLQIYAALWNAYKMPSRNRKPNNDAYVAYYRVSTQKQGQSGLGLDAQKDLVTRHAVKKPILEEFTEVESGKRDDNRPQLQAAIAACKRHNATLLIAKLDRLSRNVHFITGLKESGIDFIAADMPEANSLVVNMM